MHHTTIPRPHTSDNVQDFARTKTLRILPDIVLDQGLSPLALRAFLVLLNCRDRTTGLYSSGNKPLPYLRLRLVRLLRSMHSPYE